MTIDELLGYNAKQWSELSPVELESILKPYFQVTRPVAGMSNKNNFNRGANHKVSASAEAKRLIAQISELVKQQKPK